MSAPPSPPDETARLRHDALAWFVRRQDAGWSHEQEIGFQQWLAQDARHGEAYARCHGQWARFDGMPQDLVAGMRRELAADRRRFQREPSAGAFLLARRRFLEPVFSKAGVLALMGGAGALSWQQIQAQPVFSQTITTARGEQKEVGLPDGSRLRLDTATRLEVRYYRRRREARLIDGQAFFAVEADADRPFEVTAGPLRISLTDSHFSVRNTPAVPEREGVQVAVEQGQVRVVHLQPSWIGTREVDAPLMLLAGQRVSSDPQGALEAVTAVAVDGIAPWRHQRVSFVDVPLGHALAELARYGNTGLVVHDPAVAALRLSGTFDPMNRGTLRLALPRVLPVRLRETGGITEVVSAR